MFRLMLLVFVLSWTSMACVHETAYEGETGTLKIPFGPKEGKKQPGADGAPGF